jgi:putative membrane-bound dehydrogenase-like protein
MDNLYRNTHQTWMAFAFVGWVCLWQIGQSAQKAAGQQLTNGAIAAETRNAPAGFQVEKGFRIELVAMEPLVSAPSAIAFDEDGRLFVAEMPDNPNLGSTTPQPGKISLLEDKTGDGVFSAKRLYAENVPQPSGIACYGGGLFVAAATDLIYLKNSVTNGPADERKVIYHRLGATNTPANNALLKHLTWGLDNRIYGALDGSSGQTSNPGEAATTSIDQPEAEFSFDPRNHSVAANAGVRESGLCFDNWGRRFVCDGSHPLRLVMYEQRYVARNPFFAAPAPMLDAAGLATAVYPLAAPVGGSAEKTATGSPPATQTNFPVRDWITNACGCLIYRGNAFPVSYHGNAFVADSNAHVIHRMILRENGLEILATRPDNERNTEFLASKDASFNPVQIVLGPEGALYIVDRQNGSDRGRIYRIVPDGFKPPKPPRLGQASTHDLVAMLSHPNGWQRDTAARLLFTRQDPAAAPLLVSLLSSSPIPLARMHTLHVLQGLGALNPAQLLRAMQDPEPRVREHAARLAETLTQNGGLPESVWAPLRAMATDPSLPVRYQVAFTLGQINRPDRVRALGAIMWSDLQNPWMEAAVLSSAAAGAGNLFLVLAEDPRFRNDANGQAFLQRLAMMIGVQAHAEEARPVLDFIDRTPLEPRQSFALLYPLGEGLRRAGHALAQVDWQNRMDRFYFQALGLVVNGALGAPVALEDLRLIGVSPYTFATAGDQLLLLFGTDQPDPVRLETLNTLVRFEDQRVAPAVFRRWPALPASLRKEVAPTLLTRNDRAHEVIAAIANGPISGSDLSPMLKNLLRTHADPRVNQSALRLFGPVTKQRPEAVRQYTPALRLKGNPDLGRRIFQGRCASCHRLAGAGRPFGPDLAEAKLHGRAQALSAILEPNAQIRTDYSTYVVSTSDGDCRIGLLESANASTICLRQPSGGVVVLPRTSISSVQLPPWSLMPTGLEQGFNLQNMADLLEFLMTTPK